jgi:hypothetical protein
MKIKTTPLMPNTPARHVTRRNQAWEIDFAMLDRPHRPFVMLVIDVVTRRPLSATVSLMVVEDIVATLQRLVRRLGSPEQVWMSYGVSFVSYDSRSLWDWAQQHRISLTRVPLQTKTESERLFRDLSAFLRDKRHSTLVAVGHDIERWRQSYGAAVSTVPNVNQ